MKVMLVTGSFPPMRCGVGDYCYNLARALATREGIEVAVLTDVRAHTSATPESGFTVFPVMKSWCLSEASSALKVFDQWRPDVVHVQTPTQGYGTGKLPYFLPLIAMLKRARVVQTWHEQYAWSNLPKLLFLKVMVPGVLIVVRPNFRQATHPTLRWILLNKKHVFIRNASAIPRAALSDETRQAVRALYVKQQQRLVVFFGFIHPEKGVDVLFEIADPSRDHVVIAGQVSDGEAYFARIREIADSPAWRGKVTFTGFLAPTDAAALLSAADAVVLPFQKGAGVWNTSVHAASLQGVFVLTTSTTSHGYSNTENIYYARPGDVAEMRAALNAHAGVRRALGAREVIGAGSEWASIAEQHVNAYRLLGR